VPVAQLVADLNRGAGDSLTDEASQNEPGLPKMVEMLLADSSNIPRGRREQILEAAKMFQENRRGGRGRKPLGPEHYLEVAEVYRKAHASGDHPTKAVAEHFSVGKSSAAKKVSRARDLGFLKPARRGRAGEYPEGD
jgi:hypothetical protein